MANNEIMNFIQHYKSLNLLWDTSDKNYNNKLSRRRALGELSRQYNLTIPEVKQKIKNLRSYFSKEYHKCKKSEEYVSGWFAYEAMLFLKDGIPDEDLGSLHHQNPPSMSFPQPKPGHTGNIQNTSSGTILKKRKKTFGTGSMDPPSRGDAYGLMGRVADILTSKDEFSSFGDMISFKLRRLSPRNQAIAQNRISNLLFELEMDELHMSTVQSSPVVSNTNSYSEESGSVVYGTQQANESSHPDSMYVNTVCKVAMNQ